MNIWVPVEAALDWCEQGTLVALEKETLTTIKSAVGGVRSGWGDDDGIGIGSESKEERKSLWSPIAIRGDPYQVYEAYQRIYNMAEVGMYIVEPFGFMEHINDEIKRGNVLLMFSVCGAYVCTSYYR